MARRPVAITTVLSLGADGTYAVVLSHVDAPAVSKRCQELREYGETLCQEMRADFQDKLKHVPEHVRSHETLLHLRCTTWLSLPPWLSLEP